jgi:hypothetical protein
MAGLTAAVATARADELCDSVVSTLPVLGDALLVALDSIVDALNGYVEAAQASTPTRRTPSPRRVWVPVFR